ncbi:hypothetical protein TUZN_0768 [Thermoproteus uzoniensis 768-20]|uniref:Uncharacterized protein n=1 Tax=Thermoproteus uzoniensis (strain 768-20) TaxID=999630 RepID=F2L508_THEU7|nr:hypothetical protein [Thermoproteus uzoniensis]AEA12257.1 hypothetical protein TUZN_0768 [Thermoproteus uzoniensis 768-20]
MDFREVMRTLYKGYIYQLIVLVAIVAVSFAAFLLAVLQPPGPGAGVPDSLAAVGIAAIALAIAFVVIFFLYIFRGFRALHKLGFKWAWWLAWGPIALAVVAAILVLALALYFFGHPAVVNRLTADPTYVYLLILREPAIVGITAVLFALELLLVAARAMTLRDLHRYSGVGLFRTALYMLIAGYVLSLLPLVSFLGAVVLFAEYIAEMLAYGEAARRAPAPAPQQTA